LNIQRSWLADAIIPQKKRAPKGALGGPGGERSRVRLTVINGVYVCIWSIWIFRCGHWRFQNASPNLSADMFSLDTSDSASPKHSRCFRPSALTVTSRGFLGVTRRARNRCCYLQQL